MDVTLPAAVEPAGLAAQALGLLNWILVGGGAVMGRVVWRASSRVTTIEIAQKDQKEADAKRDARLDAQAASHAKLEVAVAALPTREEMGRMIEGLRADIREARRSGRGREAPSG